MERRARTLAVLLIFAHIAYLVTIAYDVNVRHPDVGAVHIDFVAFWAAAKLALAGEAISAFDWPMLARAEYVNVNDPEAHLFWLYPPAYLLLVMPLGLIPFTPALAIYNFVGLLAYALAARRWLSGTKLYLAIAAPAVGITLLVGNTALLWTAGLLMALSCLRDNRPILAGLLIGALTLKPQLGLMIPVALIFAGHWRALTWAIIGTITILIVSTVAMGLGYWIAFAGALSEMAGHLAAGRQPTGAMVTWYGFARNLGFGHHTVVMAQVASMVIAAAAVGFAWSRDRACVNLKAAILCFATLLSTAYAYQYELAIATAGGFLLARADFAQSRAGRAWVACIWILPVPSWLVSGLELSQYGAPFLTLCLIGCICLCVGGSRFWTSSERPRRA